MNDLNIHGLREYSVDWQHLLCLLFALNQLGAGGHRRQDVCEFIQRQGYLKLTGEDTVPYPTQQEPSWQTDIAYARKIGVIMGLVGHHEWNSWELIRDGREEITRLLAVGENNAGIRGARCYLWSSYLRTIFDPAYAPSPTDDIRPPRRARAGEDRECSALVRRWMEAGQAEAKALNLTNKLGFRVLPNQHSLTLAYQLWRQQLLDSV